MQIATTNDLAHQTLFAWVEKFAGDLGVLCRKYEIIFWSDYWAKDYSQPQNSLKVWWLVTDLRSDSINSIWCRKSSCHSTKIRIRSTIRCVIECFYSVLTALNRILFVFQLTFFGMKRHCEKIPPECILIVDICCTCVCVCVSLSDSVADGSACKQFRLYLFSSSTQMSFMEKKTITFAYRSIVDSDCARFVCSA